MRLEASNSMLKFLEEPEDGIIAILMTNNINNVLSTIISRCKVIKLNFVLNDECLDYELDECGWYAKDLVTLEGEDLELFNRLYGLLDDIEDVTDVYHNVDLGE